MSLSKKRLAFFATGVLCSLVICGCKHNNSDIYSSDSATRTKLLTFDAKNARYRSDVFNDILENRKMRDDITELFDRINFLRDYGSFKHDRDHEPGIWDLLHRLDELKDYAIPESDKEKSRNDSNTSKSVTVSPTPTPTKVAKNANSANNNSSNK